MTLTLQVIARVLISLLVTSETAFYVLFAKLNVSARRLEGSLTASPPLPEITSYQLPASWRKSSVDGLMS